MRNFVLTILLFVTFPSSLFAREWSFVADMNYDYSVTISDLWLWFKWLYFYPGDVILSKIIHTSFGSFFELTEYSYGGYFSGIISAIAWLIAFAILHEWFTEAHEGLTKTITNLPNICNQAKHYLTKEKIPLRYLVYSLLAILVIFCLNAVIGISLFLLFILNRWFYLTNYLESGGSIKKDTILHFKNFKTSCKNSFLWLLIPLLTILIISLFAVITSYF